MKKISLLNFLAFLAAFLLFQIELISAKILLPKYGGSYMVWGACIVFFQAALLGGYYFSHSVIRNIGIPRGRWLYIILLLVPLLSFPIRDFVAGEPCLNFPLALDVFGQLFFTIGPVFFVLSTASIFVQLVLSSSTLPERSNPYALYGWSNLGSFAGLCTYPFIFEFIWDIKQQLSIWEGAYLVLIAICILAIGLIRPAPVTANSPNLRIPFEKKGILSWFLLSAAGVVMFLSVTNIISMEIAPVPILWIIPLGIYLAAFVLNFKHTPWCPGWVEKKISLVIGFSLILFFLCQHNSLPLIVEAGGFLISLFILSMYCQNQLLKRKPKDGGSLTFFYLILSCGGFIGGVLTAWVMPVISSSLGEYIVGLILIALTVAPPLNKNSNSSYMLRLILYLILLLFAWPFYFQGFKLWGLIFLIVVAGEIIHELGKGRHALTLALVITFVLLPFLEMAWENKVFVYKKRDYYGVYKVFHEYGMTVLHYGSILHGMQFIQESLHNEPTAYYGSSSPLGQLLSSGRFKFKNIGAVGLGVGTLAAYGQKGQAIDFYELDPEVFVISQKYFSYTKNSLADIHYVFGDARLSLEKRGAPSYDLLVVDAFSGDSVPVHLLTKEMMDIYRSRLNPGGIVLVHISNRYLDLPVVAGLSAEQAGAKYAYKESKNEHGWELASQWMAATWGTDTFQKLTGPEQWKVSPQSRRIRVWTDEYTNVVPIFRWNALIEPLKSFAPAARK